MNSTQKKKVSPEDFVLSFAGRRFLENFGLFNATNWPQKFWKITKKIFIFLFLPAKHHPFLKYLKTKHIFKNKFPFF